MNNISMIKFHWINNIGDSITHYNHSLDDEFYLSLNNLYCVSIIKYSNNVKNVIGGFFLKTDNEIALFKNLPLEGLSFRPAKIIVDERKHPLSEDDYLEIIIKQRMKIY